MENVKVSELLAERAANHREIVGIQTWLRTNRYALPADRYAQASRIAELQRRQKKLKAYLENPLNRHGSTTAYQRGCRCDLCTVANRDYMRTYRGGFRAGMYTEPPTEHVHALMESGWTQRDIARASGVSCRTISTISNSRVKRVWSTTANALLAIEPKGTNE